MNTSTNNPTEEEVWEVLNTSAEKMRQRLVIEEMEKLIIEKIKKQGGSDSDAAIYASIASSYFINGKK